MYLPFVIHKFSVLELAFNENYLTSDPHINTSTNSYALPWSVKMAVKTVIRPIGKKCVHYSVEINMEGR